jgi:hypothetical protein
MVLPSRCFGCCAQQTISPDCSMTSIDYCEPSEAGQQSSETDSVHRVSGPGERGKSLCLEHSRCTAPGAASDEHVPPLLCVKLEVSSMHGRQCVRALSKVMLLPPVCLWGHHHQVEVCSQVINDGITGSAVKLVLSVANDYTDEHNTSRVNSTMGQSSSALTTDQSARAGTAQEVRGWVVSSKRFMMCSAVPPCIADFDVITAIPCLQCSRAAAVVPAPAQPHAPAWYLQRREVQYLPSTLSLRRHLLENKTQLPAAQPPVAAQMHTSQQQRVPPASAALQQQNHLGRLWRLQQQGPQPLQQH